MYFRILFLTIGLLGLSAFVASMTLLIRARRYYIEAPGQSAVHRGLARFRPSNYSTEGAVLARLGLFSGLLFLYSLLGPAIYWARN